MIVALKPGVTQESREQLMDWLQNLGLHIHVSEGEYQTILGLVGDTTKVDMDLVASLDIVDSVKRVTEPFKCCNRKFHPDDMVVNVGDVKVGGVKIETVFKQLIAYFAAIFAVLMLVTYVPQISLALPSLMGYVK